MRYLAVFLVLLGTAVTSFAVPEASAQRARGGVVQRVVIEGTQRVDPETIGSYLRLNVGDRFDQAKMSESVRALFRTGLFSDVNVRQDGRNLVVRVVENPIINRIAFEGNRKVKDKDLSSEITLRPRSVYTKAAVQASVARIQQIYRATGRFGATINPKIIKRPQNRVDLVFEIKEGSVTGVRRISFIGNKYYSDSELRSEILTKESAWWRFFGNSDVYDPDKLNVDKEILRRFYRSRGFAEVRIVSAVAELSPKKKDFLITFTLVEGPRYRFGKITLTSSLKGSDPKKLRSAISIDSGDLYNANRIQTAIEDITKAAEAQGFSFVKVTPRPQLNRKKKRVNMLFDVQEGPRIFVERVEISGNRRTRDEVIRRELRFAEGDAFNRSRIRLSKRRLENLGYFDKVVVTTRAGSAPDKIIVAIRVREKPTGQLTLGAGFSTQDGILGSFGISENNFLGRGQKVAAQFQISQRSSEIDLSFTEPYFLNRNLIFGVDLFRATRDFSREGGYKLRRTGGRIRLGYRITEFLTQSWAYELSSNRISGLDDDTSPFIKQEEGATLTSSISTTLLYDRRDNRFDPTTGYYLEGTLTFAGLGGTERFIKGNMRAGYFYSVSPGWVLSFVGEAGIVQGLGKDVRLNERFLIGGNNMRGFSFGGIGPRDIDTGDALGGKRYYIFTTELSFPLGLPKEFGIKGRVFTDIGSAFGIDIKDPAIFDDAGPRVTVGVGVSWRSPVGPVRFDLGFPIVKKSRDKRQIFNFSFGARF